MRILPFLRKIGGRIMWSFVKQNDDLILRVFVRSLKRQ